MCDMRQYGLVGYPLEHSFSPAWFAEKFAREHVGDASYSLFPVPDIDALPALIAANPDLHGFNVTTPHKERVIPLLHSLDPVAAAVGAVNCVTVGADGLLTGYNTDAPALRAELLGLIGTERPTALILGSGGASKAVAYTLRELGIDYSVVSRTPGVGQISYSDISAETIATCRLIINATPLGTYPEISARPPIPYNHLTPMHFLFDLVYNPPLTEFLRRGAAQGAKTTNGYGMLVRQAELSWEIWTEQSTESAQHAN